MRRDRRTKKQCVEQMYGMAKIMNPSVVIKEMVKEKGMSVKKWEELNKCE